MTEWDGIERRRRPDAEITLHVHHHFDGPVPLELVGEIVTLLGKAPVRATRARLTLGEVAPMAPTQVTVDTVNEIVRIEFEDDKGDTDAVAPAGSVATFTSDNPSVIAVAPQDGDPLVGVLSVLAEGTANIGATIVGPDGQPLVDSASGAPWPPIDSVAVTVVAGAAVGARLDVTAGAAPSGGDTSGGDTTGDTGSGGTGDTGTAPTDGGSTDNGTGATDTGAGDTGTPAPADVFVAKLEGESYSDYVARVDAWNADQTHAGIIGADEATWTALPVG